MGLSASVSPIKHGNRLFVELARGADDVREAQALRYRIFGEERGVTLKGGETSLLTDRNAALIGHFYSEDEFDLRAVRALPGRMLEVGRTCIAAEYRQGAAIAVLWFGLAGFVNLHGYDYLFGCASLPLGEQDMQAAAIMNRLRHQAMAAPEIRVTPRIPLRASPVPNDVLDAPFPRASRLTCVWVPRRVASLTAMRISGSPTC